MGSLAVIADSVEPSLDSATGLNATQSVATCDGPRRPLTCDGLLMLPHEMGCFLPREVWLVFSRFPPADLSDTSAPTGKGCIYKGKGLEGNIGDSGSGQHGSPGCYGRQPPMRQEDMYR